MIDNYRDMSQENLALLVEARDQELEFVRHALRGRFNRLFRLASKHSDLWTSEDWDEYREIRDSL